MITREQAQSILGIAIQSGGVDEVFATLRGTVLTARSVAGRRLHPPQRMEDAVLTVTVRVGKRYAMASANVTGETDIRALAARAAENARRMPEASQILPFPGAQDGVTETPSNVPGSGERLWDDLASAMDRFRGASETKTMLSYGSVSLAENVLAIASSNGLFLHQPSTLAHAQFRVYSEDGRSTGFGERYEVDHGAMRASDALREAADTCLAWQGASDIEAKRLTTVFEPRALADMLQPMLRQFSSRAITQDQSFLRRLDGSSFLGTALFDPRVTLRSDPADPRVPALPFTTDGEPVGAEAWVRNGVISQLVIDRYEAAASGVKAVPAPSNLIMDEADPVEDVVAGTEYGLLIKGFANLNILDPKNCLLSGSTRDGLFLIENGKVSRPVRNLVLRETPVYLFKELLAMGSHVRTSPTGGYFPMLLPPIKVKDVLFTQPSGLV